MIGGGVGHATPLILDIVKRQGVCKTGVEMSPCDSIIIVEAVKLLVKRKLNVLTAETGGTGQATSLIEEIDERARENVLSDCKVVVEITPWAPM